MLPSVHEPFGIAALEALKRGVPLVAANVGGLPDFVADGENGLLFDPSDPTALAAAIGRVFGDRPLSDRMISGGLETAARFSWPRVIDDLEKVYGEASGSRCRH